MKKTIKGDKFEQEAQTLINAVKESCDLMGLKYDYMYQVLGDQARPSKFRLDEITVSQWLQILKYYYLDISSIRTFYNKEIQILRICRDISSGQYPYKKSKSIKRHYRQYKKDQWRQEAAHYGFRLRWQIRINRTFNTSIRIPSIDEIIPYCIRKPVYFARKHLALQKHVFKYGNTDDFVFYDARYDTLDREWVKDTRYFYQANESSRPNRPIDPIQQLSNRLPRLTNNLNN